MKTIALALAATTLASAPASAGVYINAEANNGYTGSDYTGRVVDVHVGYEGSLKKLDYYIQGGPALVAVDGTDGAEGELSGKAGLTYQATDSFGVYGEISAITAEVSNDDQTNWGAKIGGKFTF